MRKLKLKNKEVETSHIDAALTWSLSVWVAFGSDWLTLYWQAGSLERSPSSPPGWGSGGRGRGLSDAPACRTLCTLDGRRVPFQNTVPLPRVCAHGAAPGAESPGSRRWSCSPSPPCSCSHAFNTISMSGTLFWTCCRSTSVPNMRESGEEWKTRIYIITLVRLFHDH